MANGDTSLGDAIADFFTKGDASKIAQGMQPHPQAIGGASAAPGSPDGRNRSFETLREGRDREMAVQRGRADFQARQRGVPDLRKYQDY